MWLSPSEMVKRELSDAPATTMHSGHDCVGFTCCVRASRIALSERWRAAALCCAHDTRVSWTLTIPV